MIQYFYDKWNSNHSYPIMFPLYSYMQSSRDYEELESESLEMGSEIVRLRRKLEQYLLKAEEKERELLGMREQGPQAVKDQLCARLMEENKQLRAGKYSAGELHTRYTVEPLITDPPRSGPTDWNYRRANTSEKRTHFASDIPTTDTNRTRTDSAHRILPPRADREATPTALALQLKSDTLAAWVTHPAKSCKREDRETTPIAAICALRSSLACIINRIVLNHPRRGL